jgi:hypothetical protein
MRVIFLGEESHIISEVKEALEKSPGVLSPTHETKTVHHPKATGEESALIAGETVSCCFGVVPENKSIPH